MTQENKHKFTKWDHNSEVMIAVVGGGGSLDASITEDGVDSKTQNGETRKNTGGKNGSGGKGWNGQGGSGGSGWLGPSLLQM